MKKKLYSLVEKIIKLSLIPILSISCFESGKVTQKDPSIISADINNCVSHVLFDKKNN
tara:strand:+ start:231 stop:404 length:174 start_codon:yes stop_codon:yes gene_type:complete